jgi:hypothetical protein
MYEADVFYMLIMQRCQWRERNNRSNKEQRVDLYNVVRDWEARERERDLYPHPITATTQVLLRNVGLLKYYEEATSLKGQSAKLLPSRLWIFQTRVRRRGPDEAVTFASTIVSTAVVILINMTCLACFFLVCVRCYMNLSFSDRSVFKLMSIE